MEEYIRVAIIQTTLDQNVAWDSGSVYKPRMDNAEAKRIWLEANRIISDYDSMEPEKRPHIILFPEFSVAKLYQNDIEKWAKLLGCIIIAGYDFDVDGGKVVNQAVCAIPYQWPHGNGKTKGKSFLFGKRFPAFTERKYIKDCGFEFKPSDRFFILDAGDYGKIGLAICADFYDIERFALYKGRIQHLFIIAYNKDVKSFYFLAEAISRLVYCNVVICNTGFYGGSICFSLYKDDFKRYIYKHEGMRLFTSQIVQLPVKAFADAQKPNAGKTEFKSQPPSYFSVTPDSNGVITKEKNE